MKKAIFPIFRTGAALAALGVWFGAGCGGPELQPKLADAAYKAKPVFTDSFDRGLDAWFVAGEGRATVTADTALELASGSDTSFVAVWSKRAFSENFQLEYRVFLPDTPGTHIVYFCASGPDGGILTPESFGTPGEANRFLKSVMLSYQIYAHTYDRSGQPLGSTRLRKNPSNLLLSGNPVDPCRDNRGYWIDVLKVGNRIQYFVDGVPIHDVRDRGGFGPVYMKGQIGFCIQGRAGAFRTVIDDVRVFKLIPR
jgi:hypothetical protein